MNKYVEKYQKIVNQLIKKSFPELKVKKIFIYELPFSSRFYSAGAWNFKIFAIITLFKNSRKYSDEMLKALLAHELSHLENHEKKAYIEDFIYFLKWLFSSKTRADEERKADILTIKKGYGKQYILLTNKIYEKDKKKLEHHKIRGYLSPEQIKSYMKKLKWF